MRWNVSRQVKTHARFVAVATAIATALGALIERNVLPPPWNGIAVGVAMLLGSVVSPPGALRLKEIDTDGLLAELKRRGLFRGLSGADELRGSVPPEPRAKQRKDES